ncbi:MAG TPA: amidohydrolase family protein [Planctomycetota bacterium]|nr:amidohydrolase family protein [Planctomycetota bacterium]
MSGTVFFDAFTEVGPRHKKHPAHAWRLEEVLAEMDHCSISAAMVASTTSVSYEPMHENLLLSGRIAAHADRLRAIWNAMPSVTGEFPEPGELLRLMRRHDVRALSLHPKSNAWDLLAEHNAPLLAALEAERVPVIIDRQEVEYRDLDALLVRHPALPVILRGAHWQEQRLLLPLLPLRRNLHVTFDRLQAHWLLEELVEAGLEEQLLFGSHAPLMSMGAHRCYLDYADIPERARARIAGGNLVRLLGLPAAPRLRENGDEDELMAAARRGQPLPTQVLDMHMHIVHEGMHGGGGKMRCRDGGPRGVLRLLDRLGIVGGGFMSWNGVVSADTLAGNDTVMSTLDATPPGFWGLASIDPAHYGDRMGELVPRIHADPRLVGMKPYYVHGIAYDHPSWEPWWKLGDERQYYALVHRTREDYSEVAALAAKWPRVRWVIAHCGESHRVADQAVEVIRRFPNVYAEITLTAVTFGVIDYLVEQAGADRVVYGSDLPMRDPRQQLGWVVFSRLSLADKRRVLGGNARAVLAPCLDRLPARNRPPEPTAAQLVPAG